MYQKKYQYLSVDTMIYNVICTQTMDDRSKELRALNAVYMSLDRLLRALFKHLFSGSPKSPSPPSELLDVIARLRSVAVGNLQASSLDIFADFRHKWAHSRTSEVDWLLLTQSIQITMAWFDQLPSSSVLETEKDLLQVLGLLCSSYHELYGPPEEPDWTKPEEVEQIAASSSSLSIHSTPYIPSTPDSSAFVISGKLSSLRETHKETLKGRRVMLLDGK